MTLGAIDQLILGTNPFSGVDHFSSERASERLLAVTTESAARVFDAAVEAGASGFNFERSSSRLLFREIEKRHWSSKLGLYPMLPGDTGGLLRAYRSEGVQAASKVFLEGLKWEAKTKAVIQGGLSWLTSNPLRALRLYIDVELGRLTQEAPKGAPVRAVLLHELVTDLSVALGARELIKEYHEHIRDRHRLRPGYVTRNLPSFVNFCTESGVDLTDAAIMTPFNPLGFQMAPSRADCEHILGSLGKSRIIAISVLAAGQLSPQEASRYIIERKQVRSVCLGASTIAHARESFAEFRRAFSDAIDAPVTRS